MKLHAWLASLLLLSAVVSPSRAAETSAWLKENLDDLVQVYRHLHSHPELSLEEKETSAYIADLWRKLGAEVTTGVGGYGVVGIIKNGQGPTLLLRTDLDGLPVVELTELAYASKVKVREKDGSEVGVMHACGHDVHMTCVTGAARYLAANKDRWRGTLILLGQPAEERGEGAKMMLDDGLFNRFPKPDFCVALHVSNEVAAGKVGYRGGHMLANVDSVDITMRGRGGHGAHPENTIDPIVQSAELIMSLQTIVSREIAAIEPAVITVGSIHGGTKHNIIGESCHLELTVRSYTDKVREHLLKGIERKAKAIAMAYNAPEPSVTVSEGTPALFNDEDLTARLVPVLQKTVGKENVELVEPSMGGEDFSRYGRAGVPVMMYRLGTVDAKRLERYKQLGTTPPSLHSPFYYPDIEQSLTTGVSTMSAAAMDLLKP